MQERKISAALTDAVSERELENREISYKAACEGIVLLKNDSALPVKCGKIALYGAGAAHTVKGGTGSGEVNERHCVSILEGLQLAGYEITSMNWLRSYDEELDKKYSAWKKGGKIEPDIINHMKDPFQAPCGRFVTDEDIRASRCDTAIYVVSRQAGEGADKKLEKGEFSLKSVEIASIEKIAKNYKKSILVINSGSYMDIGELDEKVSAVIYFCQQGMEGGRAFADILSGKVSPSGKLTDTWAREYKDVPFANQYSYLSGDTSHEDYFEGIYVGYRYYDTFNVKPRYHFGFGLSYTKFSVSLVSAEYENENVHITASVKNTGKTAGKETVQIYATCPEGELDKEYQRLVGFAKTAELAPGAGENLKITFPLSYLSSYSEKEAAFILEEGSYIIRMGTSSDKTEPAAVLSLNKKAILSKLCNVCTPRHHINELHAPKRTGKDNIVNITTIPIDADSIKTEVISYKAAEPEADAHCKRILDSLSVKNMIDLCVGAGLAGMFKTNGVYVPGAVGRTTDALESKGIGNVNLVDGPAGLRILKESALSNHGRLRFSNGNYMISIFNDLPGFIQNMFSAKKDDKKLYQYATSFPVETALAQTWNADICEMVGRAVNREMQEYSVKFWLGPALNIHKNPLCGRNFEYMSEDPVLTGTLAAAITKGVESSGGCCAAVKHFACNNVEDNRNKSDSRLNERALREIYLKAFEICVKKAHPRSVMTSYNLVNGVYSPNSYDLCTKVLRNEWGFDGLVMTDWFSTMPGLADAAKAIKAGNDLLMPGQAADKASISAGLISGSLSLSELKTAAMNILKVII